MDTGGLEPACRFNAGVVGLCGTLEFGAAVEDVAGLQGAGADVGAGLAGAECYI
jgi:hypothetical protein